MDERQIGVGLGASGGGVCWLHFDEQLGAMLHHSANPPCMWHHHSGKSTATMND